MIKWEPGEITTEPLQLIASDEPVTCELYTKEKIYLIGQDGRDSKISQNGKHSSIVWLTTPSFVPSTHLQNISMVMKPVKIIITLYNWMRRMEKIF
jgi:hypothetical protein